MRTLVSIRFVACCIFSEETVDQKAEETSIAAEIKKAEQMWRHRAGETRALWMFTDIYRMQYIKKTYATAWSYSFQVQRKYKLTC